MVTMAHSAVNWCNTHTHVDRTHSLTHIFINTVTSMMCEAPAQLLHNLESNILKVPSPWEGLSILSPLIWFSSRFYFSSLLCVRFAFLSLQFTLLFIYIYMILVLLSASVRHCCTFHSRRQRKLAVVTIICYLQKKPQNITDDIEYVELTRQLIHKSSKYLRMQL